MLVIDNSEWMRNGDFIPSRAQAQADAVNLLFNVKTQSNPENTVGLMTMAGKNPEILVTLTTEIGKIYSAMHHVKISGKANLATGIQIAQLVLKHRQNKHQKQRVIVFVGSPILEEEKTLVQLAKKLKKNNIAVDLINFGEDAYNTAKLEAFLSAVNTNDTSHLVTVPPGPNILSDVLLSSTIVNSEEGVFAGAGNFEFGVDPSLDPELALALRISMDEERARQAAIAGQPSSSEPVPQDVEMAELSEQEQLLRAIQMSMETEEAPPGEQPSQVDPVAMQEILESLPGVDPNDPRIQDLMNKKKDK